MNQNPHQTNSEANEKKWSLVLVLVSLVTMAVHSYLTLQHYQLKLGLSEGKSICNISATFNCDSVAVSQYASLFGIPMALLGLMSQVIFLILLLSVRFEMSSATNQIRRLLLWISLFILGTSVVMGALSSFALGTYCLFCMAAYVLSLVQAFAAKKIQHGPALSELGTDLQGFMAEVRWPVILVLLIPVLGWFGNLVILDSYGFKRVHVAIEDSLTQWEANSPQEFKMDQGLTLFHGTEPAKITIVEFADFLCPHCKVASPTLEAFTQSHKDVKLVFKVFPLDGKCNKAINHPGDGLRCRLSAAMVCAQSLAQKGWEAHHWIFERQEEIYRNGSDFAPIVENMSKDLSLDKAAFESCLNADSTNDAVLAMAQEGAKIAGTPTIFVNGKQLERGQVLPVLEALYQKLSR